MQRNQKRIAAAAISVLCMAGWSRADSVYDWGLNQNGQLGTGTTGGGQAPAAVNGMTSGVSAVAAGGAHSLSIQNGGAFAWGYNADGELGNGTITTSPPFGIPTPMPVNGLSSGVTAIAAGDMSSFAIKNGGVFGWGYNVQGELGDGFTSNYEASPVAAVNLSTGVTAVAAGAAHALAIQNGALFAWGSNSTGQLGNGTADSGSATPIPVTAFPSGVTAIAAGYLHSLAIVNGAVYAWGHNGQFALGSSNANVIGPIAVPGMSANITAIAAGNDFSLAIKNGNVFAWGANGHGTLGDGTQNNRAAPQQVDPTDLTNIIAVAAGSISSYALSSDGSLWEWGDNRNNELGLGASTPNPYLTPQHLLPPSGFVFTSITAGSSGEHAIATLAAVQVPVNVTAGQVYHFTVNPGTGLLDRNLSTLTVATGGSAVADPAMVHSNRQLIIDSGGLGLDGSTDHWTGLLDLGNNDLDLAGATLSVVNNQLRQGFANGNWNGSGGISSSSAAADSHHLTAIGVIQNNQSGTALYTAANLFDGIVPNPSDILAKFTYYGDANLSGTVDGSDYSLIDSGFLSHATGWFNGDFNYDNAVDGSDYTLIDNAFNIQGVSLAASIGNPNATVTSQLGSSNAVPEPASLSLLALGGAGLLRRLRKPNSPFSPA